VEKLSRFSPQDSKSGSFIIKKSVLAGFLPLKWN